MAWESGDGEGYGGGGGGGGGGDFDGSTMVIRCGGWWGARLFSDKEPRSLARVSVEKKIGGSRLVALITECNDPKIDTGKGAILR
jgi:CubicO group peptidase (beta-lactamase class C family)